LGEDVTAIAVVRLLPDGKLDRSFGRPVVPLPASPFQRFGGRFPKRLGWNVLNLASTGFEGVNDAVLQRDAQDAIIGVGGTESLSAYNGEFLVTRFLPTGDVDTRGAGRTGVVLTVFPGGSGQAGAAVYDPQARTLTLAGTVSQTDHDGIGLARYLID